MSAVVSIRPGQTFACDAKQLRTALAFVRPFVSRDATRLSMNAVRFEAAPDRCLRVVATDGHRIARFDCPATIPGALALTIRKQTIDCMVRALAHTKTIAFDGVRYTYDAGSFVAHLSDQPFPPYENVFPRDGVGRVSVDVAIKDLRAAMKALDAGVIARAPRYASPAIALIVDAQARTLHIADRTGRTFADEAPSVVKVHVGYVRGLSARLAINARYWQDMLARAHAARVVAVRLTFAGELDPLVVQPWGRRDHEWRAAIMPMRP